MLCTEIVSDIQTYVSTQHVLPMFWKKKSFWQRFTCNVNTKREIFPKFFRLLRISELYADISNGVFLVKISLSSLLLTRKLIGMHIRASMINFLGNLHHEVKLYLIAFSAFLMVSTKTWLDASNLWRDSFHYKRQGFYLTHQIIVRNSVK